MPDTDSGWVDFKLLKERVSIQQVLAHYGLSERLTRKGDSLVGACPLHDGDNKTSFRVSLSKNIYHCFACNAGGNIIDLAAALEGVDVRSAALRLKAAFGIETPGRQRNGNAKPSSAAKEEKPPEATPTVDDSPAVNPPLRFSLKRLDAAHPYLVERGLTPETIATFGLGFHAGKGIMRERIAIPIHNGAGELVGYAGRYPGDPSGETPKYRMPAAFKKSLELYNLHRARTHLLGSPLIVVEGFFDCMRLHQAGLPNVVAAMGCTLSLLQVGTIAWAVGSGGRVIVFFDEDEAGRAGRAAAVAQLAPLVYVRTVALPEEGMQPERLAPSALRLLLDI